VTKTAADVLSLVDKEGYEFVDLRFCDLPGQVQHFTVPTHQLTEASFEEGFGFDGSSIRGFQDIQESDMLLIPDATTAVDDVFRSRKTLILYCFVNDPITGTPYEKDPRYVAKKAEEYLVSTGIADTSYWGPEAEFYIFDDVRFGQNQNSGYYFLDSVEGAWTTGREEKPNLGYKLRYKEGHFPCPPSDATHDLRSEMMLTMTECGLKIEAHHHEVATGGQGEIDMKYASLVEMADNVLKYKYIVKNVARKHGKTATFMPKPIFMDNGTGMHVHCSLWKDGKNMFAGSGYAGLSDTALYAIGGLLRHAPALCAITNPTTNSYKRLTPGYEAPVNLAYSRRNRSAAIRIPVISSHWRSKRIEFRLPDGSSNPYLAFAAMLMAMLDGIKNKINPGEPLDKDIYDLEPEELSRVPKTPLSLEEALEALRRDHEFLLQGDVFTGDVIDTWIWYKREKEVEEVRLRPHPFEFALYYDI
jgi:glutamine synthetase